MIFLALLFLAALFISSIAGYFSIVGLTTIFPGAAPPIILMGCAFELGKLMSASWLYRFWKKAPKLMRAYFLTAIFVLSMITSIGIFGYLSRAHIEGTQGIGAGADQIAMIDTRLHQEQQILSADQRVLGQLDQAVSVLLLDSTKADRAIRVRTSQRAERLVVTKDIDSTNARITSLQQKKDSLNNTQRKLETDIGPIKYVSQLIFSKDDTTTIQKSVRLLTLLMITVFDPLAILLVVAANMQIREMASKGKLANLAITHSPESTTEIPPEIPPEILPAVEEVTTLQPGMLSATHPS